MKIEFEDNIFYLGACLMEMDSDTGMVLLVEQGSVDEDDLLKPRRTSEGV